MPGTENPRIAVSRCILGDRVRYDGELKLFPELHNFILKHFQVIPVCPEVEIGLSVPRPPVQLTGTIGNIQMTGRDNPELDITEDMRNFCQTRPAELNSIHGYIFKSRSPSCSVSSIPLFDHEGKEIAETKGLFAQAILNYFPGLPITDELSLETNEQRQYFLQQVQQHLKQHPTC